MYRSGLRLAIKAASQSLTKNALAATRLPATRVASQRLFSVSFPALNKKADVIDILNSEIRIEKEMAAQEEKPEIIESFLQSTSFKIVETEGRSLHEIVKETEDVKVHVYFDVSQITNIPQPVPEEAAAEEGAEYDDFNEEFANLNVVLENKNTNSAISVEILFKLDDGSLYIESLTPYKTAEEALSESAEAEALRQIAYHGPAFSNLDESLQTAFEDYLRSLGVNETMADFLVSYSEFKENKEYFTWLNDVKTALK